MPGRERRQPSSSEQPLSQPGTFLEIATELFASRVTFIQSSLQHMGTENPFLLQRFTTLALINPQRDVAVEWALMYYELKARPHRKGDGSSAVTKVSLDTIEANDSLEDRLIRPLVEEIKQHEDKTSPEAINLRLRIGSVLEEIDKQDKEIRYTDSEKSPEMAQFWSRYYLLRMQLMAQSEHATDHVFELLNFIMRNIHGQEQANKFRQHFPHV